MTLPSAAAPRARSIAALVAFAVALAVALPAGAGPDSSRLVSRAEALGLSCSPAESTDGVAYTMCTGEVPTFDGIGLDTDLSLPSDAGGPLPTIAMLHGWSNDKTEWEAAAQDGDGDPDKDHWNNVWFVSKGYAVLTYTARGFKESCGQLDSDPGCETGWTHLADRDWEVRDAQHLLGLLVDQGIADPARLVATGGSYGGGQSWLLATSMPWTSPGGRSGLRLAAAVPRYPWTDLLYSLVPNGRQTDDPRQGRSHWQPLGIEKESYVTALYTIGRALGEGRYNSSQPDDFGSALDLEYALVQAGEPYEASPVVPAIAAAFRNKSAYYANGYLAAVREGRIRAVPVLSIQGWTDPLFPAAETLQMYRKLKAADPGYPVSLVLADVGHPNAANPVAQWRPINSRANRFLDAYALGLRARPGPEAVAYRTRCTYESGSDRPVAGMWDALAPGTAVGQSLERHTTTSAGPNGADGAATDPIVHSGCMAEEVSGQDPANAYWAWTVPSNGLTLLGLPELSARYELSGADATVALKLWDIGPDGIKTLVTRGTYRLSSPTADPSSGRLSAELFGNSWRFEPGHLVQLQISQADAPYLRPDNLASAISWTAVRLVLPTREARSVALQQADHVAFAQVTDG